METQSHTVEQHFEGRTPEVRAVYDRLLEIARRLGPVNEEPKKTSIHLAKRTAFAGVATRKNALILTLKSAGDLDDSRIVKHEQTSANRWHIDVRLERPEQVDADVAAWLRAAYELAS